MWVLPGRWVLPVHPFHPPEGNQAHRAPEVLTATRRVTKKRGNRTYPVPVEKQAAFACGVLLYVPSCPGQTPSVKACERSFRGVLKLSFGIRFDGRSPHHMSQREPQTHQNYSLRAARMAAFE